MASSFQKKNRSKIISIDGTRPSLHNNQLLVSTGVPSLDTLLGGGLAVGTVLLVEEDTYGSYSRMLLKYQLAEAVMCRHSVLIASANEPPEVILQELPGAIENDPKEAATVGDTGSATSGGSDETMKIAWRYQNMPQVQSSPRALTKFGHYYDLTKTMSATRVDATPKTLINFADEDVPCHCGEGTSAMNKKYSKVLRKIQEQITEGKFCTNIQSSDRSILRICISSLGSPMWGEEGGLNKHGTSYDPSLCRFLYALRMLMRSAFATCVITMPTHLFHDSGFTHRIEHLCDHVIRLESFAGSDKEKNPAYKEYHGLFHIVKLPRLNTLTSHVPETFDLAFKLRRKKFTIEKLHLPPDLSETASRGDQEDPVKAVMKPATMTCGTSVGTSKLDF